MRKSTPFEAFAGILVVIVMFFACVVNAWQHAKKTAWPHFWFSFFSAMFFAGIIGWLLVDAFNGYIRLKKARLREERRP